MNWLLNTINERISFTPEIELLVALGKLRSKGISLRDILSDQLDSGEKISAEDYPELSKDEIEEINDILKTLPELLKATFGHDLNDYPEELKFLGQTFAGLGDETIGYAWQLVNRSSGAERAANDGLLFKLTGGVSTGVHIQVNPALPKAIPSTILEPATLSLTFQGAIHSGAVMEGANRAVSLKLGTQLAGTAELQYYFGHTSDTIIANALLTSLRHLKSPFDVAEITAGIKDGKHLNAIRLTADGSIIFDGQIGFANSVAVGSGGSVSAGIEAKIGFELSESGRFNYMITKAEGTPHLHVHVSRARKSSSQISEGIAVGIDMTKWAERVYPEIRNHLSAASSLLEDLKAFLPGSESLQESLKSALNDAIDDSRHKDEIKRALGFTTGDRIDMIITNKLLPQLETTASIWQENATTAALNVTAELLDRIDLGTDIENKLQAQLEKHLESSFKKLRSELKKAVTAIIDKSPADKLQDKLEHLGSEVQKRFEESTDKIAELTGLLREQLNLAQQRLARLQKPFEDASKAKILFKYEALRRDEDGRSLDIDFILDPQHPEAQEVLTEILSAKLGPHLSRDRSSAILNVSGTYKRYQSIVDSDRFNVVLFGLGFSGSTQVKINSIINVDPQGNIEALTNQEWEKRYSRSVDVRRLTFTNAREINAIADFQDITVNFGLSMEDKELEADELTGFLLPFEELGLLRFGVTAKAASHIGSSRPGHIELALALTTEQLDRMIAKAEESNGAQVLRIGAEIFEQLAVARPPNITFRDLLPSFLADLSEETASDLHSISKAVKGWNRDVNDRATSITTRTGDDTGRVFQLDRLRAWLDARHTALVGTERHCGSWTNEDDTLPGKLVCAAPEEVRPGMVHFLQAIASIRRRELDVVNLNSQAQLLEALNKCQMEMNRALRNWHSSGEDVAKWWLYKEREPRFFSIALFLLLARLSQDDQSTSLPTLSAAITFTNPNNSRERVALN